MSTSTCTCVCTQTHLYVHTHTYTHYLILCILVSHFFPSLIVLLQCCLQKQNSFIQSRKIKSSYSKFPCWVSQSQIVSWWQQIHQSDSGCCFNDTKQGSLGRQTSTAGGVWGQAVWRAPICSPPGSARFPSPLMSPLWPFWAGCHLSSVHKHSLMEDSTNSTTFLTKLVHTSEKFPGQVL